MPYSFFEQEAAETDDVKLPPQSIAILIFQKGKWCAWTGPSFPSARVSAISCSKYNAVRLARMKHMQKNKNMTDCSTDCIE